MWKYFQPETGIHPQWTHKPGTCILQRQIWTPTWGLPLGEVHIRIWYLCGWGGGIFHYFYRISHISHISCLWYWILCFIICIIGSVIGSGSAGVTGGRQCGAKCFCWLYPVICWDWNGRIGAYGGVSIRRGKSFGYPDTLVGSVMSGLVMVSSIYSDGHSGGAYVACASPRRYVVWG